MRRGELWLAQLGRKERPVLVLTRSEVIEVRELVTVAEVTTSIRGLAAEVHVDHDQVGVAHDFGEGPSCGFCFVAMFSL